MGGRGLAAEGGVRAVLVVLGPEPVEGPLLRGGIAAGRADRGVLQGAMPAFMGPILLGTPGLNALMLNAQAHPPDVELGEAVQAPAGERDAVVGPDRGRQAIGPEGPFEARAGPDHVRRGQPVAREQEIGCADRRS